MPGTSCSQIALNTVPSHLEIWRVPPPVRMHTIPQQNKSHTRRRTTRAEPFEYALSRLTGNIHSTTEGQTVPMGFARYRGAIPRELKDLRTARRESSTTQRLADRNESRRKRFQ